MKQLWLVFAVAACGGTGSDTDPGAGDNGGTGTATLQVSGNVSATPQLTNAQTPADFNTEFDVRVTLDGAQVPTAVVQITSAGGTVPLAFSDGHWRGSQAGYDEVYILDVVAGDDNVKGVRVDGPDIHTFSAPQAGATVDATMPLDIKWSRDDQADSISINTDALDRIAITDSGDYSLAAGGLKSKKDSAEQNRIELTRANRVAPGGAVAGSELSVSVENRIDVVAMPNPAGN